MADLFAFQPGQQSVDLSALVKKTAQASFVAFKELCDSSSESSDTEKKIGLLKFINKTRQRLLRLLVLSKWCYQIPLVECCQQLVGTLSNHDNSFIQAADSLFFLHESLQQARAPMYDIPSAVEVLLTGSYRRLPECIEDLGMQPMLTGEEKESTLQKLDTMLRSRLLDIPLPREITSVKVAKGMVTLHVEEEFEAQLTLGYRGYPQLWRVLHLKVLVGEHSGTLKLTAIQEGGLKDDLERRMAALEDPFQILYSVLHEFCCAWVMDTVIRQVRALQQGRWRDAIRFELIQEGLAVNAAQNVGHGLGIEIDGEADTVKAHVSPGLKIMYWLDLLKGTDASLLPSLRIEQGSDHHISCSHVPPVIDPITDYEANFHINLTSIDVERLLLKAILCSVHTRLLDVQRQLRNSSRLCRVDSDVILHTPKTKAGISDTFMTEDMVTQDDGEVGEEVLCVRAYGQSYVALGINIRSGKYVLRSHSTSIPPALLAEAEDSLNQGSLMPLDAFVFLRNKSLLQVYADIGTSIKLKVFEKGTIRLKPPTEGPRIGTDTLILAFPDCGPSFFLMLQLDNDFMPILTLIEGQPPQGSMLSGPVRFVRFMNIDVGSFLVKEDEVNFSLLNESRSLVQLGEGLTTDLLEGALSGRHLDSPALKSLGGGFDAHKPEKARFFGADKGNYLAAQSWRHGDFSAGQNYPGIGNQSFVSKTPPHNNLVGKSFPGAANIGMLSGVRQSAPGIGSPGNSASPSRHSPGGMTSPSRNLPLQRASIGQRPMLEMENQITKSPLNPGESATSPINIDDDDLSKLIDSIASKPPVVSVGIVSTFDDGVSLMSPSRQTRTPTALRGSPLYRNSMPNARASPKSTLSQNNLLRTAVSSPVGSSSPARRSPMPDLVGPKVENAVMDSSETGDLSQASLSMSSPMKIPVNAMSDPSVQNTTDKANIDLSKHKRKRSDLLLALPSLQGVTRTPVSKRRKVGAESFVQPVESFTLTTLDGSGLSNASQITVGQHYSLLLAAANEGKAPLSCYTGFLLQVSRRCSLTIKVARLCSQMDALNISYFEEVGLQKPSTDLWFRLQSFKAGTSPRSRDLGGWEHICLCLGNSGSGAWSVRLQDNYMKELYELQKHKTTPQATAAAQVIASEADSHICCTSEGLVLTYKSVEDDSIKNMMVDLNRLWNARAFALEMRWLLENKAEDKEDLGPDRTSKLQRKGLLGGEGEKQWEALRRAFRVEAIGLTSVWFNYTGSFIARFVVEWERGKIGCTLHVSPDQLWPHTKYLEDFINGGEVELLLDCIRVTAGPLHALAGAIRPARMPVATTPGTPAANLGPAGSARAIQVVGQVLSPTAPLVTSPSSNGRVSSTALPGSSNIVSISSSQGSQNGGIASGPGRGTGLVPSSLLPTDVSVVLRSPFWIRIVYRRQFAVDMRCFAGDQVWLQPAPPPRGVGPGLKGSLPCPQFRPFVTEQIATGYGTMDASPMAGATVLSGQPSQGGSLGITANSLQSLASRVNANAVSVARPGLGNGNPQAPSILRVGTPGNLLNPQGLVPLSSIAPGRSIVPGASMGFHPSHRELNAAGYTISDDGGYGGVWVPLAFLKKVLRGTLRYLGVVWLFARFPEIIKEVLATHLKENEGSLLHHDPEIPNLRFYVQNCVFAVSIHRQQLVLQAINVKRFQHQPQPQQPQSQQQTQAASQQQQQQQSQQTLPQPQQTPQQPAVASDSDLSSVEMQEIGDFFARRAAFEPYDASRLASFVTMLTLPVPVLREFIGLIAWKKDAAKAAQHLQSTDPNQIPRPKIELCLENRSGQCHDSGQDDVALSHASGTGGSSPKSSIDYDRARKIVDFTLTVIFDPIHVPHINVAGGAGWLPQCVAIRLRYAFGENNTISLLHMEGSHGGRACWSRVEEWERCKERIARALEVSGSGNVTDGGQGRLRAVAEAIQTTLQSALQQLRKGSAANVMSPAGSSL